MRDPAMIRMLPDGRRFHLHDGPIDLIIEADGGRRQVATAYRAAAHRFVSILDELCSELPLLRAQVTENSIRPSGAIARRMHAAVSPYSRSCFITPMAAVAGAVAEAVLEAMLAAAPLDRAHVNNGGDIALHIGEGMSYRVGMVERPEFPSFFGSFEVSAGLPVRGIATSGWRGRSFSLGIADAVTVLAQTASAADAGATMIANAVDLPGHPAVTRIPAQEISPDSDLGNLLVTRGVRPLGMGEIESAVDAGVRVAEQLRERRLIHSAALCLQGCTRTVANPFEQACLSIEQRSFSHA